MSSFKKSLKWQLTAPILVIVLFSFLLAAYVSYIKTRGLVIDYACKNEVSEIKGSAERIRGIIDAKDQELLYLKAVIKKTFNESNYKSKIDTIVHSIAAVDRNKTGVWFVGRSGYRDQGIFSSWYVKENDNKVKRITQYSIDYTVKSYENDPAYAYYYDAVKAKKTIYTKPYVDIWLKIPMISISTPVYDDQGELLGVCGIDIDISEIQEIASNIKHSNGGYSIFITQSGDMIYHPNEALMLKSNVFNGYNKQLEPIFHKAIQHDELTQKLSFGGKQYYYFSVKIPEINWTTISVVPVSEVLSAVNKMAITGIIILIVTLFILTATILLWITRRIFNPLQVLVEGTRHISNGEFDYVIDIHSSTELDYLSEKFNWMRENIKKAHSELEEIVAQRTEELRQSKVQLEDKVQELLDTKAQLEESNRIFEKLSEDDGLTGIPNRRSFDIYLQKEWIRAAKEQQTISVIFIDVDFFKNYNDNYGHLAGDECLKKIAEEMFNHVKGTDYFCARYGGEEFVVAMPGIGIKAATEYAETLRARIENCMISHEYSPISKYITVSMGVGTIAPDEKPEIEDLLNKADQALYIAKHEGRNKVVANYEQKLRNDN